MEAAIHVVWWIGLLGALIPTLVILKEASLILRTLREIEQLALVTAEAAHGIARHVAARETLGELPPVVSRLPAAARRLAAASGALERRLAGIAGGSDQ